jgi:NAD(P)-dependent dehydrogenase (short-subunit alcohol dehydrogenase family)
MLEVTDPRSVAEAAEAVEAALGGVNLDALVNSAGVARLGPLACLSTEALREQFEVNLFGLFEVTRRFLPLLGAGRPAEARNPAYSPGRIVNLSSGSGRLAMPFFGFYAASKHALEGLSDSLRRELQLYGIRVILIEPFIVRTPMVEKAVAQAEAFRGTDWWPAVQAALKAAGLDRPDGVLPVQRVVRVLLRALESPHPRTRYAIPRRRLLGWWLPLALPDRVLDLMVGRALGLIRRRGN